MGAGWWLLIILFGALIYSDFRRPPMTDRRDAAYWRKAYETLVAQTGRDLNDGLGIDQRRKDWLPPLAKKAPR